MKKLIFYTDLDGTLLNHDDYCWSDAAEMIQKLKDLNFPIVFNTSKTLKEVQNFREETEIYEPFIVENGGALCLPKNYFNGESGRLVVLGKDLDTILASIAPLRNDFAFESYSQMSVERISELTGLSLEKSLLSSQRICSEPLIWNDSPDRLDEFREKLKVLDLNLLKGGRFYHIAGFPGKGDALSYLNNLYKKQFPAQEVISVALGDSPNDLSMLEEADIAVVIPRAEGHSLQPQNNKLIYADYKGPKGWAQAVGNILTEYSIRSVS